MMVGRSLEALVASSLAGSHASRRRRTRDMSDTDDQ